MTGRNPLLVKVQIGRRDLGMDEESYRALLERVTGRSSSSGMSDRNLRKVLEEFERLGWKPSKKRPASDKPHVRKVFAIWADMGRAGIPGTGKVAALRTFVQRQTKTLASPAGITDPEWLSPEDANKVIEGLKAWRRRELAKRRA